MEGFGKEKGFIYVIYQISDCRDRRKAEKIESMTKKGRQKNFWAVKYIFFLKKAIRKFGPRKFFPFPAKSAPSLRQCSKMTPCCLNSVNNTLFFPNSSEALYSTLHN